MGKAVVIYQSGIGKDDRESGAGVEYSGVKVRARIIRNTFRDAMSVRLPDPHHGVADINVDILRRETKGTTWPNVHDMGCRRVNFRRRRKNENGDSDERKERSQNACKARSSSVSEK